MAPPLTSGLGKSPAVAVDNRDSVPQPLLDAHLVPASWLANTRMARARVLPACPAGALRPLWPPLFSSPGPWRLLSLWSKASALAPSLGRGCQGPGSREDCHLGHLCPALLAVPAVLPDDGPCLDTCTPCPCGAGQRALLTAGLAVPPPEHVSVSVIMCRFQRIRHDCI